MKPNNFLRLIVAVGVSELAGVVGSNGIVGGGLPISLGTAFASIYKSEDRVTVCFFGDGATNEGTFHESLNLAALWNLPIVFCCENNGWAEFTPQKVHTKLENLSLRAESYGIPGFTVDGDDVLQVREEACSSPRGVVSERSSLRNAGRAALATIPFFW